MLLNVLDFQSVQEALDVASVGDRVYFPGGRPYVAPPEGWVIRKSIEVYGDGPGNPSSYHGTVLTPSAPVTGYPRHVFVLEAGMSGAPPQQFVAPVHIHDLQITRRMGQTGADGGDGIHFVPGQDYRLLAECSIERVAISFMGGAGIRLEGFNGGNAAVAGFHISDV